MEGYQPTGWLSLADRVGFEPTSLLRDYLISHGFSDNNRWREYQYRLIRNNIFTTRITNAERPPLIAAAVATSETLKQS